MRQMKVSAARGVEPRLWGPISPKDNRMPPYKVPCY
nr:MAG TPA: hypothetical protein [Caudoviricetes sp.]